MRKRAAALVAIAFLTASCMLVASPAFSSAIGAENTWVSKAPMKVARANFGIATVNGKIYVFGGDTGPLTGNIVPPETSTSSTVDSTEEYNTVLDSWTNKTPMPTPRALLGVAVYQNKIYCIGGYRGIATAYVKTGVNEVYDPLLDTWETRASMPEYGYSAIASVVNGKIYVQSANLNQEYDPKTDTWKTRAPPPKGLKSYNSIVVDNKIYTLAVFNESSDYTYPFISQIQMYDPSKDIWFLGAKSPMTSHFITAFAAATTGVNALKRIYFFDEDATHIYDPRSDTWTVGASMLSPRVLGGTAVINDIVYVIGGRSGQHDYITLMQPNSANEQYTPFGYGTPDMSPVISPLSPAVTPNPTPPEIRLLSPANRSYGAVGNPYAAVPLIFETNVSLSWIGYSLDGGSNATATNGTLIEIPVGSQNLTVYANDTAGNWAAPQTVYYSIAVLPRTTPPPEPFPWLLVATVSMAFVAAVVVAALVFWKKRKCEHYNGYENKVHE
jgi:hypothetical protein